MDEYADQVPDRSSGEISIMTLLIGEESDAMSCSLAHANFAEELTIKYEALSYAWAPLDVLHKIYLDETKFGVRKNLYYALRTMRRRGAPTILWVDAICINQYHINERNHQVEQMVRIYKQGDPSASMARSPN
jgi:hypothetical protein